MTRINLLPWRETRRVQRQRNFIGMLITAAVIAAAGVFLTNKQIEAHIDSQEARNEYLRGEIARLKKAAAEVEELKKTRERLLRRLEVVQNLQKKRPDMVRILDTLVRLLPEDIYLNSLKTEGRRLTLNGIASSNNIISAFMRNLGDSNEFDEPVLTIVETRDINNVRANVFELTVNRSRLQGTQDEYQEN